MRNRRIFIIAVCSVIFILTVSGIFLRQNYNLNREFDRLISDNVASYTRGQRRQVSGMISDISNTLTGMAEMIEASNLSPDGEWLPAFLNRLSSSHDMYEIDYITTEQMKTGMQSEENRERDQNAYEKLLNGEGVVSEIRFSDRLGGRAVFAVAEPVSIRGKVEGALRTWVDASFLTVGAQKPSLFEHVKALLVSEDGSIRYTSASGYDSDGNVYSSMENNGIGAEEVQELKRLVRTEGSVSMQFRSRGKIYFVSAESVGYNNWYIMNFVRSPDVLIHSGGIIKSVSWTGFLLIVITAVVMGIFMILIYRQKQRLNLDERRYSSLSQFLDTVLFEYNRETDRIDFTPNVCGILDLDKPALTGVMSLNGETGPVHTGDWHMAEKIFRKPEGVEEEELYYTEMRLRCKDGSYRWFGCQFKYMLDSRGMPVRTLGKLVDISGQKIREQLLQEKAHKDALTDTYNRAGEQLINNILSEKKTGILFMLDLDHFKNINDTYGHAAGDMLLSNVGLELKKMFRADDIIARVGGDEFVIFILEEDQEGAAQKKASSIREQIGKIRLPEDNSLEISVSIGIAVCPKDGATYKELYEAADQAMYRIKQKKKGSDSVHENVAF